jgi:hypothetical protein
MHPPWAVTGLPAAVHCPAIPGRLQAWHAPLHEALQQYPSEQMLERHELPPVHVCPFLRRHVADPLHVFVPAQVSASSVFFTPLQVPVVPGRLQDWQVPPQPELQQTPSTQLLLVH